LKLLGNNWDDFLQPESQKPYYQELKSFVTTEYKTETVYPAANNVFKAFELTPPECIKVVIVGQDAYINENQATGLAFAVPNWVPAPPSLRNIKKELDGENVYREKWSDDLVNWAKNGVFLLNRTLTVRAGQSLSHYGHGWEVFTLDTIRYIEKNCKQPIVYMLWGNNAREIKSEIKQKNRLILESAHPSPLSANRGFFGNKHFEKANQFLTLNDVKPIYW